MEGTEKMKHLRKKVDEFMAEMATEMLDEDTIKRIQDVVLKKMKDSGVTPNLTK